jgi:hypothetical protein
LPGFPVKVVVGSTGGGAAVVLVVVWVVVLLVVVGAVVLVVAGALVAGALVVGLAVVVCAGAEVVETAAEASTVTDGAVSSVDPAVSDALVADSLAVDELPAELAMLTLSPVNDSTLGGFPLVQPAMTVAVTARTQAPHRFRRIRPDRVADSLSIMSAPSTVLTPLWRKT